MLNEEKAAAHEADGAPTTSAGKIYPERREHSSIRTVWKWVLRLSLPVLMGVSIKALQWLWIDNIYGTQWLDIVGGTALALGLTSIGLWCVYEWLADSDDPEKP
ncbi:MAG: hypothetical protein E6G95_02775 [Alphaproteobacteria bacterium]|nr:MAG: hypothetical protein E6G95_02775 [Alphaproteobacteria bacterium]